MAMGLVDSPMKNLNVKSWNNGKTFYAAFYDMDTGLGKSNAGSYINYFAFDECGLLRSSLLEPTIIVYEGTKEQWSQIYEDIGCGDPTNGFDVHCADGVIKAVPPHDE